MTWECVEIGIRFITRFMLYSRVVESQDTHIRTKDERLLLLYSLHITHRESKLSMGNKPLIHKSTGRKTWCVSMKTGQHTLSFCTNNKLPTIREEREKNREIKREQGVSQLSFQSTHRYFMMCPCINNRR